MKKWKIGIICGIFLGIVGAFITYMTCDISLISIPVVLLFSMFGAGLLFLSPIFEFVAKCILFFNRSRNWIFV